MIAKPKHINPELYFSPFLLVAKGNDLIESLTISRDEFVDLMNGIDSSKADFKYEKGKWSIKQVLKHICDSERVHSYRALTFSKNDKTDLPGFDENNYAEIDSLEHLSIEQIRDEFIAIRNSTIELFKSLNSDTLDFVGTGNKQELTPRIVGWKISGHSTHHRNVIKERYLNQ